MMNVTELNECQLLRVTYSLRYLLDHGLWNDTVIPGWTSTFKLSLVKFNLLPQYKHPDLQIWLTRPCILNLAPGWQIATKLSEKMREQGLTDLSKVEQDLVFGGASSKDLINILTTKQASIADLKLQIHSTFWCWRFSSPSVAWKPVQYS